MQRAGLQFVPTTPARSGHATAYPFVAAIATVMLLGLRPVASQDRPRATPAPADARQRALVERDRLWKEIQELEKESKTAEVIEKARQMNAIEKEVLGVRHSDYAWSLGYIANHLEKLERYDEAIEARQQALASVTKLHGPKNWRVTNARLAVEHTKRLGKLTSEQRRRLARADELLNQANQLLRQGKYAEAIPSAEEALALRQAVLPPSHPHIAGALGLLGALHSYAGHNVKALSYCQQNLEIREKVLGPDHPETATSLDNLAGLYKQMGNNAGALPLYQRALAIWEKAYGPDHHHTAICLNNLAGLYDNMGDYAQAKTLYQRASEIFKKTVGEQHTDYATSLLNLASVCSTMGNYSRAETLYLQVIEIDKKALGENHPDYTIGLNSLAALYVSMGNYARAEPLYEKALAIRRNVLGDEHPLTATALDNLSGLYESKGDYVSAERLAQQALTIYRKVYGNEHPETATCVNGLAYLYKAKGDYTRAEKMFHEALAIRKKVLGEEHPDTATCLNGLASLYEEKADYTAAEPLYQQALAINRKFFGDQHPHTTSVINNLAGLRLAKGEYSSAESLYQEALAIRKKVSGDEHPSTATCLDNFALLYSEMGNSARAEQLHQEALAIRKKVFGEAHPDTALSFNNLAALYLAKGDYGRAEALLRQALSIYKQAFGELHPAYANALNNLAKLYNDMGNYAMAERLQQQALAIRKKVLGEDHPNIATSMNNLAGMYVSRGDYARAEPLYRQALVIHKKALGGEHPQTAVLLNNLGNLLCNKGDYSAARACLEQALAINEKIVGQEHPNTAGSLNNLGLVFSAIGDYDAAQAHYERAVAICKKVLGENHPDTATALNNLGSLHQSVGDYAPARSCFEQALAIRTAVLGEHSGTATSLGNLAQLSAAEGNWAAAVVALMEANRIRQRDLEKVFSISSESRMRAYVDAMCSKPDVLLSMPLGRLERADAGLTWLLRRKAIVFNMLCRFRAAQWLAREDKAFAQLHSARFVAQRKLDNLTLRPPAGLAAESLAADRQAVQTEIAQLDDKLQEALSAYIGDDGSLMITTDAVRSSLPAGAALVELAKYATFKFQATGQESRWGAERYVAFVMHSDADAGVVWIDLGEAAPIDELVAELGDRIEDANRASELADWAALEDEYRESAQSLNEKLFAPIAAKLGDVKRIYLAPDGQLHNLPFEALVDGDNKYLVEQGYTFAYLTSGRDLVRSRQYEPGQGAYVFAAPNYNLPHDARYQLANHAPTAAPSNEAKTPPINALAAAGPRGTRSGDIRGLKWQVLAGMEPEGAEAANQLADGPYGDVKRYTGDAALEENFKQLSRPRLVVLITHGYFLPDQPFYREDDLLDDSAMRGSFAQGIGLARLRAQENPLYRSGVVLAGANTLDDPVPAGISVDDGWLTAEEISQLDLRGTDLVVLSACNTNRGTVATGDAVAGLRSAFLFAGARTLVGSLYEVPDQETRELMRTFYARLRQGRGKLNSLNEARLDAIRQQRQSHGAAHPFFWASFVLVGEP